MNRKEFLTKSIVAGVAGAVAPNAINAIAEKPKNSTYEKLMHKVGFNHLPNKNIYTMNTVIHRADTRGTANHGWLESHHTFSFANYHNPERIHFGVLRVLNDDCVQAGMGFGTHPHDNMEIISIPLEGDLEHKDSMGNVTVIKEGDVQIMSAGTGITHSEYNKNKDKEVKFLQIWVFPKRKNIKPRYDQISTNEIRKVDKFYQILSPNENDQGVSTNQDAWFSLGKFSKGASDNYKINKTGNGVYFFVLNGKVEINGETLSKRDGMGLWDIGSVTVDASENADILVMEVPMVL